MSARLLAGIGCLVLTSALAGLGLARRPLARAAAPPAIPITIAGEPAAEPAAIAARWGAQPIIIGIGGDAIVRARSELGAAIDVAALEARVAQAHDPTSLMRRFHAQTRGPGAPLDLPLPIRIDPAPALAFLLDRREQLDARPLDARIEPRTGAIVPERDGLALDVHATLDAIMAALRAGAPRAEATINRQAPRRTARELAGIRLEAQLGVFETRYSTQPEAAARTHNLRLAASRLDGTVLMPGEMLRFNDIVGERSEANGFRPAPEIAAGELIDGVGGGTCQIAGTLHAAAFFAGLPIVQRSPHSRPSTYLWMGLDAVVVYGAHDLLFTNDLPFPIAIGMSVEGGVVRAEIRGARPMRTTTFVRRIEDVTPFRERTEIDPTLPAGVRVLRQRGVPGFRITRFRIVRDLELRQARRQRREDLYPPTERIVRVGSGAPAPPGYVAPPGDDHPEYTTDEYLSVTQGAGIDGTDIVRRGGRSTTPGWTDALLASPSR